MCSLVKEVWGMKLHFVKGKWNSSDFWVCVSEWENKVMDTEMDEKRL